MARHQIGLLAGVLGMWAAPAWAQHVWDPGTRVEVPPVEVSVAITINSLGMDVNAPPNCVTLNLPCTHRKSSNWGGFGLAGSLARNVTPHVAVASEVGVSASSWDSWESRQAHRTETNTVRTLLAGPKVSTGFSRPSRHSPEPARFFAQILTGLEVSDVAPARRAVEVGGGVDVIGRPHGIQQSTHEFTLRLELDYRRTPGGGRNNSGWRSVFGLVIGPRTER